MDCALIQTELIAYYFGTCSDEERERIDEHLLSCTACLRAYLLIKRHVERGARASERPSSESRERLRAQVIARFKPTRTDSVRRFFRRPMPLYQGLAIAALVAVAIGIAPMFTKENAVARGPGEEVDSARSSAESHGFY
jgi:anti-sigma factor RsiW